MDVVAGPARARIGELLEGGGIRAVFHPVVELSSRRAIGFEALARFPDEGARPPSAWFADAAVAGLRSELEVAALRAAVRSSAPLPRDTFVALNLSPRTAVEADLRSLLAPLPFERVVLDINEGAAADEFEEFGEAIGDLRRQGLRIALDDTGEGFVSLRHVVGISPDLIKIGLEIIRDVDTSISNQAVASALCAFASRMGATTVAEGIETEAELRELVALGVEIGQGYLFGRPQPAEHFAG